MVAFGKYYVMEGSEAATGLKRPGSRCLPGVWAMRSSQEEPNNGFCSLPLHFVLQHPVLFDQIQPSSRAQSKAAYFRELARGFPN